jgi:sporulation integral membrane protein YtvI
MLPLIGNGETESGAQKFNDIAEEVISAIISSASSALPGVLSSIVSALPGLFLGLAVTIISAFYFTLDREKIKRTASELLPSSLRTRLPRIRSEAGRGAAKYLRAYSLIMLITFGEIFLGLSLLGVEYSFLIALVTAVIDILPILGVGTLLIPWAVISFLTNNYFMGVGLLILYAVIMVVRQIIEPKILGGSLGVHPLLTLAALYIGYRLAGFTGMLIAPLCLIAWRALRPSPNADTA